MADVVRFNEWAGSARGLDARPVMPNDTVAMLGDIESIHYAVNDILIPSTLVEGDLDPDDVMFADLQVWLRDKVGYSFLWDAPGTLWPTAGHTYRIVITFTTTAAHNGRSFILVWEVTTQAPTGP